MGYLMYYKPLLGCTPRRFQSTLLQAQWAACSSVPFQPRYLAMNRAPWEQKASMSRSQVRFVVIFSSKPMLKMVSWAAHDKL